MLAVALAVLLALLQYRLWWGAGGLVSLHRAQGVLASEQARNATLRDRNASLSADVSDLAKGGPAIEARAREELGMIHQGETFYLIVHPPR
ncbi:MAG TPA: cell division protein FtsB [Nevskiaceae bacterium]